MNAYKTISNFKKLEMWNKVKKLFEEGLNKSQISRELGIHRDTVRKYLGMSEVEFLESGSFQRKYHYKLEDYQCFVYKKLDARPYLSSSQIHDHLKEKYPDLPKVNKKTVYNYVSHIRQKYNIPKLSEDKFRLYEIQPEDPYGDYAQVDFGERYMDKEGGGTIKVYFFAIVLTRSRQKFIYFSERPFTTASAIYAHQLAFQYYQGIPKRIIYDQDKVFIYRENLGDYIYTNRFRCFLNEHKFEAVFCRKNDPESKGKVENVVKYVKQNFLRGRDYVNIDILNKEAIQWLSRTGNGEENATTRKIPSEEFEIERDYLSPYVGTPVKPKDTLASYTVRKDNVISYHSNYYTVPTGTYKGRKTYVYVEILDDKVYIYSAETGKTLAIHTLCTAKGKIIQDKSHLRKEDISFRKVEDRIKKFFNDSPVICLYLREMHDNRKRYYKSSLNKLEDNLAKYSKDVLNEALEFCSRESIYNVNTMLEIAESLSKSNANNKTIDDSIKVESSMEEYDIQPEKTDINTYNSIFK